MQKREDETARAEEAPHGWHSKSGVDSEHMVGTQKQEDETARTEEAPQGRNSQSGDDSEHVVGMQKRVDETARTEEAPHGPNSKSGVDSYRVVASPHGRHRKSGDDSEHVDGIQKRVDETSRTEEAAHGLNSESGVDSDRVMALPHGRNGKSGHDSEHVVGMQKRVDETARIEEAPHGPNSESVVDSEHRVATPYCRNGKNGVESEHTAGPARPGTSADDESWRKRSSLRIKLKQQKRKREAASIKRAPHGRESESGMDSEHMLSMQQPEDEAVRTERAPHGRKGKNGVDSVPMLTKRPPSAESSTTPDGPTKQRKLSSQSTMAQSLAPVPPHVGEAADFLRCSNELLRRELRDSRTISSLAAQCYWYNLETGPGSLAADPKKAMRGRIEAFYLKEKIAYDGERFQLRGRPTERQLAYREYFRDPWERGIVLVESELKVLARASDPPSALFGEAWKTLLFSADATKPWNAVRETRAEALRFLLDKLPTKERVQLLRSMAQRRGLKTNLCVKDLVAAVVDFNELHEPPASMRLLSVWAKKHPNVTANKIKGLFPMASDLDEAAFPKSIRENWWDWQQALERMYQSETPQQVLGAIAGMGHSSATNRGIVSALRQNRFITSDSNDQSDGNMDRIYDSDMELDSGMGPDSDMELASAVEQLFAWTPLFVLSD